MLVIFKITFEFMVRLINCVMFVTQLSQILGNQVDQHFIVTLVSVRSKNVIDIVFIKDLQLN